MTVSAPTRPSAPPPPAGLLALPGVAPALRFLSELDAERVTRLLRSAAYVPILIRARADREDDRPEPHGRPPAGGYRVRAVGYRFPLHTVTGPGGELFGSNVCGEPLAEVTFGWQPIPEDHRGEPAVRGPAVPLDPSVSQRIELFDFVARFGDGTTCSAYGTGRTWPSSAPGEIARFTVVLDVLEGTGLLAGLDGTLVIDGELASPTVLGANLLLRLMDFERRLDGCRPVEEDDRLRQSPLPVTYMTFFGEVDPARPVELRTGPSGAIIGSRVFERLRSATIDAELGRGDCLASRRASGPVVGAVEAELTFNPFNLSSISPIQTRRGVFSFHDAEGEHLGTVLADMTEGRSFRTWTWRWIFPFFHFSGFGPILGGSGEFEGASGQLLMNSAISVFPRTLANLYVLRFDDPHMRLRAAAPGTGR